MTPQSTIAVLAKLTAKPGNRDQVVAILSDMVAAVEDEPGTVTYALHTANDDDVTIWFYERYTDDTALAAHSAGDAMKALGPRLAGLMAARPEIIRLTPHAAKGV